jgi:hypothetical protein
MNQRKFAMMEAMGVTLYRKTRRVRAEVQLKAPPQSISCALPQSTPAPRAAFTAPTQLPKVAPFQEKPVALAAVAKPTAVTRAAATRAEFVLPQSELERFLASRMYRHFCTLLVRAEVPVVENAVTSDTALHFELPNQKPLKLGSLALLRSAWRAKRQAWLAIRLWRKQQAL